MSKQITGLKLQKPYLIPYNEISKLEALVNILLGKPAVIYVGRTESIDAVISFLLQ